LRRFVSVSVSDDVSDNDDDNGAPGEAWARRMFGYRNLAEEPSGRKRARPAKPSQQPEASLAQDTGGNPGCEA
jgi:hypothetical protein